VSEIMKTYFAILHKDADSAVGVVFPDLPGCFSAGDSYDEAIRNAEKALALYAEAESNAGRALPEPSPFDRLFANREIRDEAKDAPFVGISLTEIAQGRSGLYRHPETGETVALSGGDRAPPSGRDPSKRRAQSSKGRSPIS
jgi:predicted RNase H-like HicB family nuclease